MRISYWSSDVCSSDLSRTKSQGSNPAPPAYSMTSTTSIRLSPTSTFDTSCCVQPIFAASSSCVREALRRASFKYEHLLRCPGDRSDVRGSVETEEGRVVTDGVSTCLSRWSPYH